MVRKTMVQNFDTMQQLVEEMQIDINAAMLKQELFEAQVKLFEDDLDAKRAGAIIMQRPPLYRP